MNWLDFAILAVAAWLTLSSFATGFVREAINLLAMVLGVALAGFLYEDLARDVELFVDNQLAARLIAFLVIFAAVALAGHLTGLALKTTLQLLMLGGVDRLLGGLVGLLKAFIVIEAFLLVAVTYPSLGLGEAVAGSRLAPFFVERLPLLVHLLPTEFKDAADAFVGS